MSESEKRMLEHLPEVYAELDDMKAIAQGCSAVLNPVKRNMDDTFNQVFIDTATWGLEKWEKELKILPTDMDYVIRRKVIKRKINQVLTANKSNLETIANLHSNSKSAKIRNFPQDYYFIVDFETTDELNIRAVMEDIEEAKPAHLDYAFSQVDRMNCHFATSMMTGEECTVYPWTPTNIEINGKMSLGSYVYDYETTSVYPGTEGA